MIYEKATNEKNRKWKQKQKQNTVFIKYHLKWWSGEGNSLMGESKRIPTFIIIFTYYFVVFILFFRKEIGK